MANKKNREINLKNERDKKFRAACFKLRNFPIICLALSVLTILLFLVNFAEVFNTDYGAEVKISGFNTFFAAITGQYTSEKAIFGNMAVPFNYYAESYVHTLGILTLIAVVLTLANLVVQIVNVATNTKNSELNLISLILGVLQAGVLIACFIVALSMKDAKILSTYCSGNPKCSIRSYAIIPAITALIGAAVSGIATVKYFIARKILKA